MISSNSIKKRLRDGERLNGCFIEIFSPIATEIVALSGYDTAFIDLEHGPGSYTEAISMMQALNVGREGNGCAPIIRTSSSDITDIKRALDIAPEGIMVPNVRNRGEAEEVVKACRYGPDGVRGAAPGIIRATRYGTGVNRYAEYMANDFLIIIQIESGEAVEDIENIAGVDGIDMLFIGPSDLSASLGAIGDFSSQVFNDAFARIEKAAIDAGKSLGMITLPNRDAKKLYSDGYSLIVSGTDTLLLQKAAMEDVAEMQIAGKGK